MNESVILLFVSRRKYWEIIWKGEKQLIYGAGILFPSRQLPIKFILNNSTFRYINRKTPSPSLLPTFNLSQDQGLFKWVRSLHPVAKVLEFQFQQQSFYEDPGLISFRMDWLNFHAVQGILKSLLQYHSSKASIIWCSTFFVVQLSHPYKPLEKS